MKTLRQFIAEYIYDNRYYLVDSANCEYQDAVAESFSCSFDVEKLISSISGRYDIPHKDFEVSNSSGMAKAFSVSRKSIQPYLDDKWLEDILCSYGYYWTQIQKAVIVFEPIFSDNITDKIQSECGGKIYKLVDQETLNKIKGRKGICVDRDSTFDDLIKVMRRSPEERRKASRKINTFPCYRLNDFKDRKFTSRCYYFSAADNQGLRKALAEIRAQIEDKNKTYYMLEIDISEYNVNCYLDTFGGFRLNNPPYYLLYINAFFPDDVITVYTLDEFNKKIGA